MLRSGSSALEGSWKMVPTSRPRTVSSIGRSAPTRSTTGGVSSVFLPGPSRLSNADPLTVAAWGSRPRLPSAVTDLPEPDSPTSASTRPGIRSRLTASAAGTGAPENFTVTSRRLSTASGRAC